MNFHFAEYEFRHGWAYVLGLLVASGIGTLIYLRRRRWI
jgi:LPXTG-motif cell wall-anchored protein